MYLLHIHPTDVGRMTLGDFFLCADLVDQIIEERQRGQ